MAERPSARTPPHLPAEGSTGPGQLVHIGCSKAPSQKGSWPAEKTLEYLQSARMLMALFQQRGRLHLC